MSNLLISDILYVLLAEAVVVTMYGYYDGSSATVFPSCETEDNDQSAVDSEYVVAKQSFQCTDQSYEDSKQESIPLYQTVRCTAGNHYM